MFYQDLCNQLTSLNWNSIWINVEFIIQNLISGYKCNKSNLISVKFIPLCNSISNDRYNFYWSVCYKVRILGQKLFCCRHEMTTVLIDVPIHYICLRFTTIYTLNLCAWWCIYRSCIVYHFLKCNKILKFKNNIL